MSLNVFHRADLASALTKRLLHPDALQTTSRDGLFLTGVRRIGKTTFIRQDLIPQLEKERALVIYVDLWENNEDASPAKKVLRTIRRYLTEPSCLKSIKVALPALSFTFEPKQAGDPEHLSLAEAFSEIIVKCDINVVLIIDEIQETLKSEAGRSLLVALKAARDAVNLRANNPSGTYLLIVGTGSHRSFVSAMAAKASQPFYGADRIDFPVLDDKYIDWQIDQLSDAAKVPSKEVLSEGFAILGHRPKVFRQVLAEIQNYPGREIDQAFRAICLNQAKTDADEFLMPIRESDLLTRLLFTEIAKAGPTGCRNLFASAFLTRLSKDAGRTRTLRASAVQSKLTIMQKKDWIFPVSHGSYAISDPQAAGVWLADLEENLCNDWESQT